MTLLEFLKLDHRFKWSGFGLNGRTEIYNDCITFPATWVHHRTGVDIAREYRGTYHSKEEADALIADAGGLVALAGRQLETVGGKRVQNPMPGDVGIISAPIGDHAGLPIGAICFGKTWAFITPPGVLARKAEFVAAWRIPACA